MPGPLSCDVFEENVKFPYRACLCGFLFHLPCHKSLGSSMCKNPFLFLSDTSSLVMRKITQTTVLATLRLLLTRHFPWELWTLDLMHLPKLLFTV